MKNKTYNVKCKAIKTNKNMNFELNVIKKDKKCFTQNLLGIANLLIVLNDNKYQMSQLYPEKYQEMGNFPINEFDTSELTTMEKMFYGLSALYSSPDLSGLDTSKVTNMTKMFSDCYRVQSLNLPNFNTSNVTNMESMFSGCINTAKIDVSSFDTNKVVNMRGMFHQCASLTSLDLSNFNTNNVTNMESMFSLDVDLETLDISNFDTSKVTDMSYMFSGCKKLKNINGVIDMKSCTEYAEMFKDCPNIGVVHVKNIPKGFFYNVDFDDPSMHFCIEK